MRKIIHKSFITFIILVLISGCVFINTEKNPILENEAFDIIGDQGINDSITIEDLQGEYDCTLWFVEYEKSQYSEDEYNCTGRIDGNELYITWEIDGESYAFGEGINFELVDGIMTSDKGTEPILICAVKLYPSGHMVDGLGILEINESDLVRIHFQMVK